MEAKKCKVEFKVNTTKELGSLFILGNLKELGEWNPDGAVELKYNAEKNEYSTSKMLPLGSAVSYKVCAKADWETVEVGYYGEDVANHEFVTAKGHKEVVTVNNFRNI